MYSLIFSPTSHRKVNLEDRVLFVRRACDIIILAQQHSSKHCLTFISRMFRHGGFARALQDEVAALLLTLLEAIFAIWLV